MEPMHVSAAETVGSRKNIVKRTFECPGSDPFSVLKGCLEQLPSKRLPSLPSEKRSPSVKLELANRREGGDPSTTVHFACTAMEPFPGGNPERWGGWPTLELPLRGSQLHPPNLALKQTAPTILFSSTRVLKCYFPTDINSLCPTKVVPWKPCFEKSNGWEQMYKVLPLSGIPMVNTAQMWPEL